ncbi:Hsp70 family protein [Gordonia sp. CPCC 205515]|uniref:Hsp70 family protein n=1 Tax=Gordonia sp. CPCC 205515 TaxID=3140791 RepID=UPI003AF3B937
MPSPSTSAATWTLAIDFGTSNSAAAHSGATTGRIETLSLTHTSNLMPSSVFVAGPQAISVGDAAINQAQQNPAGFVPSPKRLIGGAPTVTVNNVTLPTYALVSAVMRAIIARGAAAHAGAPPTQLVLTHPEAWARQQIRVLVDAAAHAGIDPARIVTISEPRAAAAHYSRSHAMQPGAKIAVFDFGGGTLDVAVLTVTSENAFSVVAARGDNGLGGKNLDALIGRWVEERLDDRDPNLVTYLRRQAPVDVVQSLQESIRRAKELLSEAPSATITVPTPGGRQTLQITRDEFDELIGPSVAQSMSLTRATLLDAGITHPEQLTALYLTGGSSRIPLVQRRLAELGRVATLDDPKTVVAQGALVTAMADAAPPNQPPPNQPRGATMPGAAVPGAAVPGAADLMPSWQGAGTAPNPAVPGAGVGDTGTPKRRWGRIAVIGVAALAIVGIVAGVVAAMNRDEQPDTPSVPSGSSASVSVQASGDASVIRDQEALLAALPATFRDSLTTCTSAGYNVDGALRLTCKVDSDSSLASLGASPDSIFTLVMSDVTEAKQRIKNIRNGIYSDGKGTLVENDARTAAADIARTSATIDSYTIKYANTSSGLVADVQGLRSIEDAKTFLTRSGLMS